MLYLALNRARYLHQTRGGGAIARHFLPDDGCVIRTGQPTKNSPPIRQRRPTVPAIGSPLPRSVRLEALRSASLDFLDRVKSDRLTHPFYWGGFVVVGKDSPIEVASKSRGQRRWFFAAGLLVFAVLIMYIRRRVYRK